MKKCFLLLSLLVSIQTEAQPITLLFKPNAAIGQDAQVWSLAPPNQTDGDDITLNYSTWTWGGYLGSVRGYIRFTQLINTIPQNAIITAAKIKFFGIPQGGAWAGNSVYAGSSFAAENTGFLSKVNGAWTENTIVWGNQPPIDNNNFQQIAIPSSATEYNWDWENNSSDLVAMVQDMVSNPNNNWGFQVELQNEQKYRRVIFASSDYPDCNLWPELQVTYIICPSDFSYCFNTANPYQVSFAANGATDSISANYTYSWSIDGQTFNGANATYTFSGAGNYKVCLDVSADSGNVCSKCIDLCLGKVDTKAVDNTINNVAANDKAAVMLPDNMESYLTVSPNPTTDGWNINLLSPRKINNAGLNIYNMSGKKIIGTYINVSAGQNSFYQSAERMASGTYIIEIIDDKGESLGKQKIVKN